MAIDREKVLLAAQGFIQKKRYDKAVAEYQKIIQQDPDDARTLLKIGDLQSKMEAHADAVATYDRVGKYYASQGFALKAIAVYKQIREIIQREVPQIADRYGHITLQLAQLYEQLGITNDALAAYDEIATQLQKAGQDAQALEYFRKLVELDEYSPLAHLRLAEAYSRVKNIDDAIRHFSIAAQMLMKANRHDDALKVFERLLHHRPEPIYARRTAEIYLERGKPNDGMLALAKLQICFQADPKSLETLTLLARAFVVIGQPVKSIEVQKELARTAKEQGNHAVWRETVNKLLQLAPNDDQVQRLASSPPGKSVSSVPAAAMQGSEPPPSMSITDTDSEIEELSADDIELDRPSAGTLRIPAGSSRAPVGISHAPAASSRAPAASSRAPASARAGDARAANFSAPELEVGEAALGPGDGFDENIDPSLHPRRILSDAESYLKLGLQEKAISRLEQGIAAQPRSILLRRKLRDVLYEAGEHQGTADQMVAIAGLLIDDGDTGTAAEELSTVLSFVPNHPAARQMLLDLGYELPTSEYSTLDPAELSAIEESAQAESGERPSGSMAAVAEEPEQEQPEQEQEEAPAEEPLDAVAVAAMADYDSAGSFHAAPEGSLPRFRMDDEPDTEEQPPPQHETLAQAAAAPKKGPTSEVVEDALEEAEFFLSRGLFDDARAILEEHLRRLPDHPLLVERMQELEQAMAEMASSSGTRERPEPAAEEPEDRAFDIAASLDALDALDSMSNAQPEVLQTGDQIDVEEVFAKFKAGVRAQVSETDSSTHYDLGLAYREMDLVKDAIDEFELAARDPKRECVCQSMIGMIHRQQGDVAAAIEAFIKGLHAEHKTPEQELSLYYELGDAYEAKGNPTESLYYFRKVAHRAPDHDDPRGGVAERIRALQVGHRPSRERAVGQSDEFNDAFDALSGGKH